MRDVCAITLTIALCLCGGIAGAAELASLHDFELKNLRSPEVHKLERYAGKPLLMFFFQPDCNFCYRQVRVLNRLEARCSTGFHTIGVGVNGSRQDLKRELRRSWPGFPSYEASAELLASIGGVPPTPFSLLGDGGGIPVQWRSGYLKEAQLTEFLAEADGPVCPDQATSGSSFDG